jgi:hypothetical protein
MGSPDYAYIEANAEAASTLEDLLGSAEAQLREAGDVAGLEVASRVRRCALELKNADVSWLGLGQSLARQDYESALKHLEQLRQSLKSATKGLPMLNALMDTFQDVIGQSAVAASGMISKFALEDGALAAARAAVKIDQDYAPGRPEVLASAEADVWEARNCFAWVASLERAKKMATVRHKSGVTSMATTIAGNASSLKAQEAESSNKEDATKDFSGVDSEQALASKPEQPPPSKSMLLGSKKSSLGGSGGGFGLMKKSSPENNNVLDPSFDHAQGPRRATPHGEGEMKLASAVAQWQTFGAYAPEAATIDMRRAATQASPSSKSAVESVSSGSVDDNDQNNKASLSTLPKGGLAEWSEALVARFMKTFPLNSGPRVPLDNQANDNDAEAASRFTKLLTVRSTLERYQAYEASRALVVSFMQAPFEVKNAASLLAPLDAASSEFATRGFMVEAAAVASLASCRRGDVCLAAAVSAHQPHRCAPEAVAAAHHAEVTQGSSATFAMVLSTSKAPDFDAAAKHCANALAWYRQGGDGRGFRRARAAAFVIGGDAETWLVPGLLRGNNARNRKHELAAAAAAQQKESGKKNPLKGGGGGGGFKGKLAGKLRNAAESNGTLAHHALGEEANYSGALYHVRLARDLHGNAECVLLSQAWNNGSDAGMGSGSKESPLGKLLADAVHEGGPVLPEFPLWWTESATLCDVLHGASSSGAILVSGESEVSATTTVMATGADAIMNEAGAANQGPPPVPMISLAAGAYGLEAVAERAAAVAEPLPLLVSRASADGHAAKVEALNFVLDNHPLGTAAAITTAKHCFRWVRSVAPPPKPKARAGWSGEEEDEDFEGKKVWRRAAAAAPGYEFGDELVMEVEAAEKMAKMYWEGDAELRAAIGNLQAAEDASAVVRKLEETKQLHAKGPSMDALELEAEAMAAIGRDARAAGAVALEAAKLKLYKAEGLFAAMGECAHEVRAELTDPVRNPPLFAPVPGGHVMRRRRLLAAGDASGTLSPEAVAEADAAEALAKKTRRAYGSELDLEACLKAEEEATAVLAGKYFNGVNVKEAERLLACLAQDTLCDDVSRLLRNKLFDDAQSVLLRASGVYIQTCSDTMRAHKAKVAMALVSELHEYEDSSFHKRYDQAVEHLTSAVAQARALPQFPPRTLVVCTAMSLSEHHGLLGLPSSASEVVQRRALSTGMENAVEAEKALQNNDFDGCRAAIARARASFQWHKASTTKEHGESDSSSAPSAEDAPTAAMTTDPAAPESESLEPTSSPAPPVVDTEAPPPTQVPTSNTSNPKDSEADKAAAKAAEAVAAVEALAIAVEGAHAEARGDAALAAATALLLECGVPEADAILGDLGEPALKTYEAQQAEKLVQQAAAAKKANMRGGEAARAWQEGEAARQEEAARVKLAPVSGTFLLEAEKLLPERLGGHVPMATIASAAARGAKASAAFATLDGAKLASLLEEAQKEFTAAAAAQLACGGEDRKLPPGAPTKKKKGPISGAQDSDSSSSSSVGPNRKLMTVRCTKSRSLGLQACAKAKDLFKQGDEKRPGIGVDFEALLPLLVESERHFQEAAAAAEEGAAADAAAKQKIADAIAARVKMGFAVDVASTDPRASKSNKEERLSLSGPSEEAIVVRRFLHRCQGDQLVMGYAPALEARNYDEMLRLRLESDQNYALAFPAPPGAREAATQAAADAAAVREKVLAKAKAALAKIEQVVKEAEDAAIAAGESLPMQPKELDRARAAETSAAAAVAHPPPMNNPWFEPSDALAVVKGVANKDGERFVKKALSALINDKDPVQSRLDLKDAEVCFTWCQVAYEDWGIPEAYVQIQAFETKMAAEEALEVAFNNYKEALGGGGGGSAEEGKMNSEVPAELKKVLTALANCSAMFEDAGEKKTVADLAKVTNFVTACVSLAELDFLCKTTPGSASAGKNVASEAAHTLVKCQPALTELSSLKSSVLRRWTSTASQCLEALLKCHAAALAAETWENELANALANPGQALISQEDAAQLQASLDSPDSCQGHVDALRSKQRPNSVWPLPFSLEALEALVAGSKKRLKEGRTGVSKAPPTQPPTVASAEEGAVKATERPAELSGDGEVEDMPAEADEEEDIEDKVVAE